MDGSRAVKNILKPLQCVLFSAIISTVVQEQRRVQKENKNFLDKRCQLWHNNSCVVRGVAQFGRAPGLGPGGRRFESCRSDHLITRQ